MTYSSAKTGVAALLLITAAALPAIPLQAQQVIIKPSIIAITPPAAAPGARVTIHGGYFSPHNNLVRFHGPATASLLVTSSTLTTLDIVVPFTAPGTYQVTVRNGNYLTTEPVSFTILPRPGFTPSPSPSSQPAPIPTVIPLPGAPAITSIDPPRVEPAARVTIHGRNFTPTGNRIEVVGQGRRQIILVTSPDTTTLTFAAPVVPNGTYHVSVTNGRGQVSNPASLEIHRDPIVIPVPTLPPLPSIPPFPVPTPCPFGDPLCRADLTYVALGDSIARGLSAFQGYVARYEDLAENTLQRSINDRNLAQNGWTSTDLRRALETDPQLRQAVADADIITWNVGGNDLRAARTQYQAGTCGGPDNQQCIRTTVAQSKNNFTAITHGIANNLIANQFPQPPLRSNQGFAPPANPHVLLRSMDIYYPYVDEDRARDSWPADNAPNDFVVFKPYVDDINAHIGQTLTQAGIPYARVYDTFNGPSHDTDPEVLGLISFDEFHPNDRGHAHIAELLHRLGYANLQTPRQAAAPVLQRPQPSPISTFLNRVERFVCRPNQFQVCVAGRCFCNVAQTSAI